MPHAKFVPKEKGYVCTVKGCKDKQQTLFEKAGEITAHLMKAHKIAPDDQEISGIKDIDEFNKNALRYLKKKGIKIPKSSPEEIKSYPVKVAKGNHVGVISVTLLSRLRSGHVIPVVIDQKYLAQYIGAGVTLEKFIRTALVGYFS